MQSAVAHTATCAVPSGSPVWLRRHVYGCVTGELLILLDGRSGKYYGIPLAAAKGVFSNLSIQGIRAPAPETPQETADIRTALASMHLITTDQSIGREIASPRIAAAKDLIPADCSRHSLSIREAMTFLHSAIRTAVALRLRSFHRIVSSLEAAERIPTLPPDLARAHLPSVIQSFRTMRAFTYNSRGNCLYDSIVLRSFLLAHQIPSTLVIAVGTRPFGAHCWVQYDGLVLNDVASHVNEFTPLIAV